jgi:hypothetical protein
MLKGAAPPGVAPFVYYFAAWNTLPYMASRIKKPAFVYPEIRIT